MWTVTVTNDPLCITVGLRVHTTLRGPPQSTVHAPSMTTHGILYSPERMKTSLVAAKKSVVKPVPTIDSLDPPSAEPKLGVTE